MKNILLFLILFFASNLCIAQLKIVDSTKIKPKIKKDKNFRITPFLTPGYTPDLKFTVATGTLISFRTDKRDSSQIRSSIPIALVYSFDTKSVGFYTNYNLFFPKDKYRVYASVLYRKQGDNYFGIGYQNALNTHFPDSTFYKKKYYLFQTKLLKKVATNFYIGLTTDINSTEVIFANSHMHKDPLFIKYGPNNLNTGIGFIASYDSRDFPQNALKGEYLTIFFNKYSTILGGNNNYLLTDLDLRKYINLLKNKVRTLALNWRSKYTFGDVPYAEIPTIGTLFDLRGYLPNQFKDKYLNYFLSEFRYKIYQNNIPTKLGFVTWVGMAGIGNTFPNSFFKYPLPNAGFGIRLELQPRLNVRGDWGFGKFKNTINFSFQEAF